MTLTKLQSIIILVTTIDHVSPYIPFFILEKAASLELDI